MISLSELNSHNYPTDDTIDANLQILLEKMNKVRSAYNIPMIVTSGLRSQEQQDGLIAAGKSNAPHSKHLTGQACDIADADRNLTQWVQDNMDLMIEIGLWFEDFNSTPTWVHFQVVSPASGKRVFIP